MFIIGITGPSGAGKTTALRVLERMGGQVYDCDAVYHEMLGSDAELLGRIEAAFPGSVRDGALDRKALGSRVFADPDGLRRLTDLTQPLVAKRVLEQIRASGVPSSVSACSADTFPREGRLQKEALIVIDAIGLFESGLGAACDLTVAVVADEETRIRRLMERDGVDEAYARARIAAQKPAAWFAERAELVLENNGAEAAFEAACERAFTLALRYRFLDLRERPALERQAAEWFHSKWGVPEQAYLDCMDAYLAGETELGWYLCLAKNTGDNTEDNTGDGSLCSGTQRTVPCVQSTVPCVQIVGGLGVIENDFHDRKDLTPNVCAVFTEPEHRGRGIAGRLLNMAVESLRARGISPVYLVTDHTGFYERYGWEFFCHAQGDGEDEPTRLYIHK